MTSFTKFDASEFLDSDEVIEHYLAAAFEDKNPDLFIAALGDVAKSRGMSHVAAATGLSRKNLYKSLRSVSKLRYETAGRPNVFWDD